MRRHSRSMSRPCRRAIAAGLAYVTEDRKALGLILDEPILRNITLANLPGVVATAASSTRPRNSRWPSATARR